MKSLHIYPMNTVLFTSVTQHASHKVVDEEILLAWMAIQLRTIRAHKDI